MVLDLHSREIFNATGPSVQIKLNQGDNFGSVGSDAVVLRAGQQVELVVEAQVRGTSEGFRGLSREKR